MQLSAGFTSAHEECCVQHYTSSTKRLSGEIYRNLEEIELFFSAPNLSGRRKWLPTVLTPGCRFGAPQKTPVPGRGDDNNPRIGGYHPGSAEPKAWKSPRLRFVHGAHQAKVLHGATDKRNGAGQLLATISGGMQPVEIPRIY